MCSRQSDNEDGINELPKELASKAVLTGSSGPVPCRKCGNPAQIVLRARDAYCTLCHMECVIHKFRSALGKSKLMKNGEKVLIAFSGGISSAALLRLTKDGLDEPCHKKLRFLPVVAYIDEGVLFEVDVAERKHAATKIASIVQNYGFSFYFSPLEMVMAPTGSKICAEIPSNGSDEIFTNDIYAQKLRELFHAVHSLSAKEDLVAKLRQNLLHKIASTLGCAKVFLAESETRIAVRVLADIAQGKGAQLAENCGFVDHRFPDVLFLRPLREILAKELAFYVSALHLQTIFRANFATKQSFDESIQRLTENFVFGLNEEFPATVSTIFKTGNKMTSSNVGTTSSQPESEKLTCFLCSGPLSKISDESVETPCCSSTKKHDDDSKKDDADEECCCQQAKRDPGKRRRSSVTMKELEEVTCYSCQIILKEMTDLTFIPEEILKKALISQRRQGMKSEIAEFLLNPETT